MTSASPTLSLAGIPVTAGVFGKFYIVAAGASAALWTLIIVLVLTSVVGLFYYLRVVVTIFSAPPEGTGVRPVLRIPAPSGILLGALSVLLVWFGVYPSYVLQFVASAVQGMAH